MNIVKLFTFSILLALAGMVNAQTELIVEVNTDINPTETSWILYDLEDNVVASRAAFEKSANHKDTITLDNSSCYYWRIFDAYGDGLSAGAGGSFSLFLDGSIIYESEDPNFGDSTSVYSLGQICSSNDINVLKIGMLYYISKDLLDIKFECVNQGSETIQSVEFTYSVDGEESASKEVSDLNIEVGEVAIISHPDLFDFDTPGFYTIDVNVTKVNGEIDPSVVNNSATLNVEVVDGFIRKNVMEDFASYECGPCWDADVKLNNSLSPFHGTYTFVKYMSWDFADRKYFPEIEPLLDYYNAGGLPHIRLNGERVSWTSFAPAIYEEELGIATPVKITVEGSIIGDSIYTKVVVYSSESMDQNLTLRGVILENECYDIDLAGNNKVPFHHVAYSLIEDSFGETLEGITAGQEYVFENVTSLYGMPLEEGSLEDLTALFFLQNTNERMVYQSEWEHLHYESIEVVSSFNIEDNTTGVDTAGLFVEYNVNRLLFDADGKIVKDVTPYITLTQDSFDGAEVPYNVELLETKNGFRVFNQYKWRSATAYHLKVEPMFTLEGAIISESQLSFTIKDYNQVSIANDAMENRVNVYPNPVKDILNVDCLDDFYLQIIDMSGKVVMQKSMKKGIEILDISMLENGIYFIQLTDDLGISNTQKIIKK